MKQQKSAIKANPKKSSEPLSSGAQTGCMERINKRNTEELILAFCGPLGSGYKDVAKIAGDIIKKFGYETNYISIRDVIVKNALSTGFQDQYEEASDAEKINMLQNEGNKLRQRFGHDILALYAIREIAVNRKQYNEKMGIEGNRVENQEPRRFATIIESLKHPREVELLRIVYGNMLYLFGVLCPEGIREKRLCKSEGTRGKIKKEEATRLIDRDKAEDDKSGQQLIKTLHKSDFFVRNIADTSDGTQRTMQRYLELLLGQNRFTPTIAEYAMFSAYSAALRSGCISKQVGSAIVNVDGDIISTGRNDVPKYGGGLYTCDDKADHRCFNITEKKCMSSVYRDGIIKDIASTLMMSDMCKGDTDKANSIASSIANETRIGSLIEFSRAIHAEMDAIVSAARRGISIQGCSMYCTAFPCHNCARHIVASGIKEVYYIEPYEKSLATELHDDSIELDPASPTSANIKVHILPFEGVAPRVYLKLFAVDDRKEGDRIREINLSSAKPIVKMFMDSFIDYELKVVQVLKEMEESESL